MARRRLRGCLLVAAVAACAWAGCKDKEPDKGAAAGSTPSAADVDKRCLQLAKVCGDKDKHVAKILDECKLAAKAELAKGCVATANAVYDCYERELCGNGDKVWAIDDLRVLAERKTKCVAERKAHRACVEK